ncbi:MAG: OmpA family protein [Proteobacteria bacterium]|nr:OmpA family protein [Pseudomonadota bacterium]
MKNMLLKGCCALSVMIIACWLVGVPFVFSDSLGARGDAKVNLFNSADQALKEAQLNKAELFSPRAYKEGVEYYNDADEAFSKGKDLAGIERKLSKAVEYFKKALETSGHASEFFQKAKKARDDAENVDALKYEYKLWKEADDRFNKAILRYENGDLDKARTDAKDAEKLYRDAELETIKTSYLDSVRKDIRTLKDLGKKNNAPKIFTKAEKLTLNAAKEIERQRYSNDNAGQIVAEAGYESKHALYVHHLIRKMKDADYTFEDVVLEGERSLTRICDEAGIVPKFDKGLGDVDRAIVDEIKKLKFKNNQLEKNLQVMNEKAISLESQISRLMNDEEELKRQRHLAEDALKKQKMKQAQHEKKIQSIRSAFAHDEGKVLMDGKNVIIRLYGLNFPSGKAVIEPRYFGLLTKVKKSFAMFRDCEVVIEGHTDALGSDAVNQKLSEERAEAVKQYILANAAIPESRITAIGYGETKPVASNETEAGQTKNRRIDVVIVPATE